MLIFDFNRDIKPALTLTIFDEKIFTDMAMVKISDCFYNVINLLCFAMNCHSLQIRQVSGKLADCAVQFAN